MKNRLLYEPKHLKELSLMLVKIKETKEQDEKGIFKKIKKVFK